jgi:hypothetical protein
MNSLQVWLAIVGGLVLAAVVGHSAWQTRRVGGKSRVVSPPVGPGATTTAAEPPVLATPGSLGTHQEPSFDDAQAPTEPMPLDAPAVSVAPAGLAMPVAQDRRLSEVPPPLASPVRRTTAVHRVDPLIDAIATLRPEQGLFGEAVLAHWPPSRRAGGKSFLIEGRVDARSDWETPQAGHHYAELRAGLQLANRLGPINEIEYSEFVQIIQRFAEPLAATAEFPDMLDEVARARALDRIAVHHDAQLAMRLTTRQGQWPVGWILQHAGRHGFVAGSVPGRLVLPGRGDDAPPVLALVFDAQAALAEDLDQSWVSEAALVFEVPQTPQSEQPFNAWCASGQALAMSLDALVHDDEGRPLNADAFALIREDLDGLYAKLAEFGLPAGSSAARRLFS